MISWFMDLFKTKYTLPTEEVAVIPEAPQKPPRIRPVLKSVTATRNVGSCLLTLHLLDGSTRIKEVEGTVGTQGFDFWPDTYSYYRSKAENEERDDRRKLDYQTEVVTTGCYQVAKQLLANAAPKGMSSSIFWLSATEGISFASILKFELGEHKPLQKSVTYGVWAIPDQEVFDLDPNLASASLPTLQDNEV